ncbi:alpha/beta fold hydrolase [Duganella sp. FT80W]|uniref:Alpha/beta fold hydrolase n=1 Tax=Duganella guangzhouensis TaxID=2666084 RepID=A0A6I2KUC9_9BURK|nr:alpha/beta hydrolase [Duganella guangzhouensis]MRW89478.1 alpha/beta fold hydrolase [Duganella guangzhouensis]
MKSQRQEFIGAHGHKLSARLDAPDGEIKTYALFAHCFTCGKDVLAARRIAQTLTEHGIAVLRFDFTGLGASEGEFANTNFSSNLADLVAAADCMRESWQAPSLLIGHSLGGAAALAAAEQVPEVKAVVTIAAPSSPVFVTGMFSEHLEQIARDGEAEVLLAGRPFRIKQQFVDDAGGHNLKQKIAGLKRALLVMHAPGDDTVAISNAMEIFTAARHPKSFVSLDDANHLLTGREDAAYVANLIAAWADRYLFPVSE